MRKRSMRIRCLISRFRAAVLLLLCPALACAQSTFGRILGAVIDGTGAAVPQAVVHLVHEGEGSELSVVADAQGNYDAPNLKPGGYTVKAVAPGFKIRQTSGLHLAARQTLRVDLQLELGELTESINVEEKASIIATETGTIASSLGGREVLQLPVNFRGAGSTSPYRVLAFLPGVQSDNSFNYSVQGALPAQTEVSLDGISTVNVANNSPHRELFPSAEAIAEIKVQAVGNNAEFGQIADITTVSKSGSNQFHGSLFEYFQNRALDAVPYGATSKPQKTANDFGGSLGGPLVRNRAFFFTTFEGMQYRTGSALQATVPTAAMRAGDFSKENVTIQDPLSKSPYPGNRIPASALNSVAAKVFDFYPLPNYGSMDTQQASNFRINAAAPITSYQNDVRLDQILTSKQNFYARWTWKNQDSITPTWQLLPSDKSYVHTRSLVLSHNYTLTPSLLNEMRFGISNNDSATEYQFDGKKIADSFGLRGLPATTFNGLPSFSFSKGTSGFGKGKPSFTYSHHYQWNNNLTWVRGKHTWKFGADVRRMRAQTSLGFIGSDNYGNLSFDGRFSGSDVADFLLGLPYSSSYASVRMDNDGTTWHYALFAQDSYKLSRRITLEYGLRWELHPPFRDANGNITNFDRSIPRTGRVVIPSGEAARALTAPGLLLSINACPAPDWNGIPCTPFISADQIGWPETLRFTQWKSFAPRFGFAWRPFENSSTVVRGGVGRYIMATLGGVYYSLTGIHSSDVREFSNSLSGGKPLFALPDVSPGTSGVVQVPYGQAYFGTANDPNFKDPHSYQWHLTVERQLGEDFGLRVSYIGLRSLQLPWAPDLNQPQPSTTPYSQRPLTDRPFPYWGRIYSRDTGANAIYNSMQVEAHRRFSNGLGFNTAWTWAKNLSDAAGPAPTGWSGATGGGRVSNSLNRAGDRGNVIFTRRHRWITSALYDLPFGRGRRFLRSANPVLDLVAGGWTVSSILLLQTGPYLTPTFSGGDPSGTGADIRGSQRPDALRDGNLPNPSPDRYFDRSAFVCPGKSADSPSPFNCSGQPIGRFGNAGVGTLVGPGTVNLSAGIGKTVSLRERVSFRFDATFTNAPNHPNLSDPGTNISSLSFGRVTSARGADSGGNRVGQLGLRVEF